MLVERIKEIDQVGFYYLKQKLVKYLYWALNHGKNRPYINQKLDFVMALLCDKTWRLGIEYVCPELNFLFSHYQK